MPAAKTKNLFVRDRKGRRHFLVVVGYEKQVNLAALSEVLGVKKLSIASTQRLQEHLGVEAGSVTILALANDADQKVELVLDRPIAEADSVRCHPLVNTATLSLSSQALNQFLQATGHSASVVDVPKRD